MWEKRIIITHQPILDSIVLRAVLASRAAATHRHPARTQWCHPLHGVRGNTRTSGGDRKPSTRLQNGSARCADPREAV